MSDILIRMEANEVDLLDLLDEAHAVEREMEADLKAAKRNLWTMLGFLLVLSAYDAVRVTAWVIEMVMGWFR